MIPYPTDAQAKADHSGRRAEDLPAGAGGRQRRQPLRPGGGKCPLGHPHRGVQGGHDRGHAGKDDPGTAPSWKAPANPPRRPRCTCGSIRRTPPSGPWSTPIPRWPPPLPPPASPWTSRCSRRRWSNWAPCRWPPLPSPAPRGWQDSVAPLLPGLPGPAAGIPRRRHLGHQHGAGPLPVGVPGTGGHRHPAPAHLGVPPGHPP